MFGFILKKAAQRIYKKPLPKIDGLRIEKNVKVRMRDGISLMVNIYLPEKNGKYPVIMCMTPYGKDEQPEHYDIIPEARAGDLHATQSRSNTDQDYPDRR